MRAILWLTTAAAVLYGGYWAVGSRAVLQGAEAALTQMKADGLAGYDALTLTGFPSRFDLRLEAPALRSPDGRIGWQAAFLQIFALSYKPHHIIAVWPPEQTLSVGPENVTITTRDMRASAVFGLDADLPLDHAQMIVDAPQAASDAGWGARAGELRLAIRQGDSAAGAQDIGAEALDLAFDGHLADRLAAAGGLAPAVERMWLDAALTFDGPIDRLTPERGLRLTGAEVRAIEVDWGTAALRATGSLTVDDAGQPEGRLTFRVTDWRAVLSAAKATGLVEPDIAATAEKMLAQLSQLSGDASAVELPLIFSRGWMSLGPLPLGPAPRF
ncbi:MAG: DUF2125 domain-containing protein [Rhodobacteraceae bacterium]|nr:DUF2125 domain-containing protein [Paracoccaceae bacterium]